MMVDILWSERRRLRRSGARAYNYRGAFDKPGGGKHAAEPPSRPRGTFNYVIEIVSDPLDVGGFRKGVCFSVVEYTEMKHRCAFTPGTILNVRGTLRIIRRQNGYQVARKCEPG